MDILKLSQEEVITKVKEMGIKELRALRKELGYSIPNLANLKKVELQDALIERILENLVQPEVEEAPEVEEVIKSLTPNEIKILNAMRNNEYSDALEFSTWSFTAIENSGIEAKRARGVISSLVKKGLVVATGSKEEEALSFTDLGKELFTEANGESCQWGGPKLLEEKPEVVKTKKATKTTKEAPKNEDVVALKDIIERLVEDNKIPVMNMKKVRRILRSTEEVQGTHSKDGKFRWEWPIDKKEEVEKSLETLLKDK